MEHPGEEIAAVVRSLVQNSSVQHQIATINKYFTEDSELYHPLVSARSRRGITGIFVVRSWLLIHWSCDVTEVMYDAKQDPLRMAVHTLQHCRPWWTPFRTIHHPTLTILELREVFDPKKEKVVKLISRQHDYFKASMAASEMPVFGIIYGAVLESGVVGYMLGLLYAVADFFMKILGSIFGQKP